MPEAPDLISVAQAVKEFGISVPTLYRHLASGALTRYKRPTGTPRVFVDRRELRKLLEPRPARKKR